MARKVKPAAKTIHGVDRPRVARAVREILLAIGEDPDRPGLRGTPDRVARMYDELFAGLREDPAEAVRSVFVENYNEIVLVRDIPFHSVCEHHLLPFNGRAHVAYIPHGKVLGVSKLARIVDAYARRPQIQERLTNQIADLLAAAARPTGVAVILEAAHTCMTVRGVKKPGSTVITSAMRGIFLKNTASRAEIMSLVTARR